jgi:hypothetical protein
MKSRLLCAAATALTVFGILAEESAQAQNLITWSAADSLIDTTDYTGLGPWYWFANFNNPNAVTGAPMNQSEARNLPKWLHFGTDPALIGKDDSGLNDDTTSATGYSFTEPNSSSIGGQPNPPWNDLTLPNGTSGSSGQAVDVQSGTGTTTSMATIRILDGAPTSFNMWVVLDNGSGTGFNAQDRLRVNLRDTDGAPNYNEIAGSRSEAEVLPNGERLNHALNPFAKNGVADAWAFSLSDVGVNDLVVIRPTSAGGSFGAFAGIIITPEPSSVALSVLGLLGFGALLLRRRK